ncbi:50S ribosomal protein L1 [Candidatus Hepatoplasma crinochetorum Av]|uniref:Large ribosomal subunit protein uL1 n=1 Tax=Candidatus Hepatoplasma crinochetorum Av TaxID=1427984 RepID=W8GT49_9MOLU|nr:50S ribosomal protein L1 [Candidatus Hepatoplasma crinochetorum]AHK22605.1 50S ribosomal protein L1 [Candidatus Hepatoplasma crinochetorum Av]
MVKKISKQLKKANDLIDRDHLYSIDEGLTIIRKISYEKFDPSVEVSFNLNLDVKKASQQLRGSIVLPHGVGKIAKVLVVGDKNDQDEGKKAGADYVNDELVLEKIQRENWFDFNYIVTTPKYMAKFAKYGKLLGPKGLMPNPKLGTVTKDVKVAVENIKKGQIEYRTNDQGLINLSIGKLSFSDQKLKENYQAIFNLIKAKRPSEVKGEYIINISLSTTMGPGIRIAKD